MGNGGCVRPRGSMLATNTEPPPDSYRRLLFLLLNTIVYSSVISIIVTGRLLRHALPVCAPRTHFIESDKSRTPAPPYPALPTAHPHPVFYYLFRPSGEEEFEDWWTRGR